MKRKMIVWLPNGFDPKDPRSTDAFSRAALDEATSIYKTSHPDAFVVVLNSVVRDRDSNVPLREVMLEEARARINPEDIVILNDETTGSPTDGLAIAEFVRKHAPEEVAICAFTQETAGYYRVMYRATARYFLGYDLRVTFTVPAAVRPNLKSRLLYRCMRLATQVAAVSSPTFKAWWRLLNHIQKMRRRTFGRTVTE